VKAGDSPAFSRINLTPPRGDFVEGLRVKPSETGWAGVFLGTDGSDSGTVDGQWSILRLPNGNLAVSHNSDGSARQGLTLKKDGGASFPGALAVGADPPLP
jgi:hypothetical protein